MELKRNTLFTSFALRTCLNRTFMELKLETTFT